MIKICLIISAPHLTPQNSDHLFSIHIVALIEYLEFFVRRVVIMFLFVSKQGNVGIGGENRVYPQSITLNLRPGTSIVFMLQFSVGFSVRIFPSVTS